MKSHLTSSGAMRLGLALVVVLGLTGGGLALFLHGGHKGTVKAAETEGDEPKEAEIPVKIVSPRFDASFTMTEKRPADVRPYFEADLETRVPGIVLPFTIDAGSKVKEGEELLRVSVPDLKARVTQRQADLELSRAQVKQKEAGLETAEAQLMAAEAKVEVSDARLRSNVAYQKFRGKQEKRYTSLLAERAIDERLVDEQEDRLQASIEAVNAAKQELAYAKAEVKAAKAHITQAKADLEEARKNVDAKQAELGYAEAMFDYSIIKAPFEGVIVRREADPGDFVQNAGTGHAKPLLTIQRNDIVTVVVRVPDNYAAYITPNTEAIFETPSLPGVKIHGKVTRYPPSLVNPEKDRTMLVEVDLWNRTAARFAEKMKNEKFRARLKKGMPDDPKGGLPVVPKIEGRLSGVEQMHLLPGYFGQMTLVLRRFDNVYMLPSQAVVTPGGVPYIWLVEDGKAHRQRVSVQVNDGKLANIQLLNNEGVVLGELTGKEQVIVSNQGQLSEGQPVKATPDESWKAPLAAGNRNEKR